MKILRVLCIVLITVAVGVIAAQAGRIVWYSSRMSYSAVPYTQHPDNPTEHILFLGDSTAVGIGAESPERSTAGWMGKDHSQAQIQNISGSGWQLMDLTARISEIPNRHYDLIVIQIGANDIMRLTPIREAERSLWNLIKSLQPKADAILVLHSGDVGTAPIFIPPFSSILSKRSYQFRDIYQRVASDLNAAYIDLISARTDALFLSDPAQYYAPDRLHLSGEGYREWYKRVSLLY